MIKTALIIEGDLNERLSDEDSENDFGGMTQRGEKEEVKKELYDKHFFEVPFEPTDVMKEGEQNFIRIDYDFIDLEMAGK